MGTALKGCAVGFAVLLALVAIIILANGLGALDGILGTRINYEIRQNSPAYIDSMNTALSNDIVEYEQTNESAGKQAILTVMCSKVNKMAPGTVATNVQVFINQHGGCR